MFDVSWGELFVLTGVSIALVGRKDLPKASYFLGSKVGQVVGLLQGARARADKFATNNDLKALQNELRSGLREIDAVKGELAIAASSRGLVGRGLGGGLMPPPPAATVSRNQNSIGQGMGTTANLRSQLKTTSPAAPIMSNNDYLTAARERGDSDQSEIMKSMDQLPPRSQSVAAVAEEEWEKQGIAFKSRAEMGTGSYWGNSSDALNQAGGGGYVNQMSGSSLLSDLMQQSLIHDQYNRAVLEQDEILRSKVEKSREKAERKSK